jgi:Fic family protein
MQTAEAPRDSWPTHRLEARHWHQTNRGGTREDRTLSEIRVSLPPRIALQKLTLGSETVAQLEAAMRQITILDGTHASTLQPLGILLLRTESVASSKIESVEASLDDYARALHGIRSNPSAVSMVAATNALDTMISNVSPGGRIELTDITAAHAVLMANDTAEAGYAGRLRDVQNWIGGSDYSPRNALYVPPPPETVGTYMSDLLDFVNRDDLPVLAQGAIAHAQFESIHPFTDGNGRIGRALINTIFRRRGATSRIVIPLASALVARRDHYFDLLGDYRAGEIQPLLTAFSHACRVAASESVATAARLEAIPGEWRGLTGPVRADSATGRLLTQLPARPVISSEEACSTIGSARSSVFAAIARLHEAGVLRPLTDRKRDQVWGAGAVLDELDDLSLRIAAASR